MHNQEDSYIDDLGALILAAGQGTRMYSDKPKVLQSLLHVPMFSYVYNALSPVVGANNIWSVIGFQAEQIVQNYPEQSDHFIYQKERLGTGHALKTAAPVLKDKGIKFCLVVNGDAPLISTRALSQFIEQAWEEDCSIGLMTLQVNDPGSYGRVLRNEQGQVQAIIEARDFCAQEHDHHSNEVNTGIYFLNLSAISPLLKQLSCENLQKEYYITQLVDLAVLNNLKIFAQPCGEDPSYLGVNNPEELIYCEEILRSRIVDKWVKKGVIIRACDSVRIGPDVSLEPGSEIVGPCEIYGQSKIAAGSKICSHCILEDCLVDQRTIINSFSYLEKVHIADNCQVGPFARLRPGTNLEQSSKVGNFVEVKNSTLGKSSKAGHLTYLGDTVVGQDCNIGAGTITCNYDGKNKHCTLLGNGVFIGSNTSLVAPLKIGNQALIGAGSTITKDVPDNALSVAREKQKNFPGYASKFQE